MRKTLSVLLALILVSTLSLTAFAALPDTNPVGGASQEVRRSVNLQSGTDTIIVYYNTGASKEMLQLANNERKVEGLPALAWNDQLESAALTRAVEQYFAPSHTRPDGSGWRTVSKLVNGENVAGGSHPDYYQGSGVMADWMTSPGHMANILDTDYKSMAAASISTDTGTYWTQLFSVDSGSGTAQTTTPKATTPKASTTKTTPQATSATPKASGKVNAVESILTQIKGAQGATVAVSVQNAAPLSAANIQTINASAGSKVVTLYADTVAGTVTQGRLYINPKNLAGTQVEFKLGLNLNTEAITAVKSYFNRYFTNKIAVFHIEEQNLLASTPVAVKLDLQELNTQNLNLYTYNATTKECLPIGNSNYSLDKSGYLHFSTSVGGYIIVSDGPLTRGA